MKVAKRLGKLEGSGVTASALRMSWIFRGRCCAPTPFLCITGVGTILLSQIPTSVAPLFSMPLFRVHGEAGTYSDPGQEPGLTRAPMAACVTFPRLLPGSLLSQPGKAEGGTGWFTVFSKVASAAL